MNPALNPWMMRPMMYPPQFQPAPNAVPPPQRPQQPPVNQNGEGNGHFYLFLKLAFLVYIFSQGGSTMRTILLSIGALIAFL